MTTLSIKNLYTQIMGSTQIDNKKIVLNFLKNHTSPDVKKTHLFEGRYENIYLNEQHISELKPLINHAITLAESILNVQNLRAGYWFNYMPPGSMTTLHTHDDYDELLSAVYYVYAPADSGNLIIHNEGENQTEEIIIPEAGKFVFFKPDVRHEVTRNNSTQHRLSIGINFGPSKPA